MNSKVQARLKRHGRARKKAIGTSLRPRLSVYRALRHMYAQIIDDTRGIVLVAVSTLSGETEMGLTYGGNVKAAAEVGKILAEKAKVLGITKVVFDKGGRKYHGRIKSLANAAREGGLDF